MSFAPPPHPYPSELYSSDTGEVSARLRRDDAPHDIINRTGSADYLATGDGTGGKFGLYRWNMGPEPSGPGPHFHKTMSESFFVISGTVKIYNGTEWIDTHPGDYVYVPEGGVHGFRNESGADASMLILFSPGAPRERYFEGLVELGQLAPDQKPTDAELLQFYLDHDNHWLDQ
jgi:mannose-6-phosphate isomerase-like protein (cupin superfamily)